MTDRVVRRVALLFRGCAIYGAVVLPLMLLAPPLAVGEEVRLGFVGIALTFQWVFWIIAGDPGRYRRLMLPGVAEKVVFAIPALALVAQGRAAPGLVPFALIDLAMGIGFAWAWVATGRAGEG